MINSFILTLLMIYGFVIATFFVLTSKEAKIERERMGHF